MALKPCRECGTQVSTTAKACPSCGAKVRRFGLFGILGIGMASMFSIGLVVNAFQERNAPPQTADQKIEAKSYELIERGKEAIRQRMKDPDSAKFRAVYFHLGREGVPVTCGEVNAKNAFGGMAGFQRFISAGRQDLTFLERDVKDFDVAWRRFCK